MPENLVRRLLPVFCDLPDGRRLAYREYGDPHGYPVLNNHGGLVCGTDISAAAATASRLGLRIISPDRPGVGLSSPLPGRTTGDWAADVEVLMDRLQVRRFGVFGWSLGGQYALAVAAGLPDRVERAVTVAGTPELDAGLLPELNATDRTFIALAADHPHMASTVFGAMGAAARYAPGLAELLSTRQLCQADRNVLAGLPGHLLADSMAEALHSPAGMVEEYLVESRPWGFRLAGIEVPVELWQGSRDTLVPAAWAGLLAGAIPGAQVHMVDGEGHFLAYSRWDEVLGGFA